VISIGLTSSEAQRRLTEMGYNSLPQSESRSLARQIWAVVREPMLSLLIFAGVLNCLLAEILDASILMATVFIIVGISLYQEHRTENALVALRDLSSPQALVVRDGVEIKIAGKEVVPGDVVILSEGDRIPADGTLISCSNFSVDESMLTGESLSVRKKKEDPVFSGTLVLSGYARAVIDRTGARTELGKIGVALQGIEIERTYLQQEVDRLVRVIYIAALLSALAVFLIFGATRGDWLEGGLAGIAASMALIPEEFPVILTLFLALGAWKMSQKHVIARRAPVIETLGSATVICVDKTGTLTMNQMAIQEISIGSEIHALGESEIPSQFYEVVQMGLLASPISPFDPMDKAFRAIAERDANLELKHEYPLRDDLLAMTHLWQPKEGGDLLVATKGAPETIADLCRLTSAEREKVIRDVDNATERGFRVLGIARATFAQGSDFPETPKEFEFQFIGLVHLHDPVRPGVPAAVEECARAGVRTIMITGDYPGTALSVAREIGLNCDAGVITGSELNLMSDETLAERMKNVSVFARMVPEQKLRLVRALKMDGEVVGMTGDGVNDAPALRAADIGIAMGGRGTDVAREAASLVITDDDFTSIAGGIRQGRGIFANLQKAMSYVIAVHVPILGMALIPVFVADWPLVLLPAQIAFLELIIDPGCSLVFEAEGVDPEIMNQRPRGVGEKIFNRKTLSIAIAQGLGVFIGVIGVYFWALITDRSDGYIRTMTFATLMVGNVSLILVNRSRHLSILQTFRSRRNITVKWVILGAITMLGALVYLPFMRRAFDLTYLHANDWLIVLGLGLGSVIWFDFYKRISRSN
jgi:Ca2+-transporting ATPase